MTAPEPIDLQFQGSKLDQHRAQLKELGEIIAGKRCIRSDIEFHYFYRVASAWSCFYYPELAETSVGTVAHDADDVVSTKDKTLYILSDHVEEALEFLTSIIHLVSTKRRELALEANRSMPASNKFPQPGGVRGHLLQEYNVFLEQLQHEYRHQRRRLEGS